MRSVEEQRLLMNAGWQAWDERDWMEAHDQWEEAWMELGGVTRSMLQSMIQLAVSLVHLEQGNLAGAKSLCAKSLKRVSEAERAALSADYAALLPWPDHVRRETVEYVSRLEKLPARPCDEWAGITPPALSPRGSCVSAD